jgi:hypothetical protein
MALILASTLTIMIAFNRNNFDYKNYVRIFEREEKIEIGYLYLIKGIKLLGGTHNVIVILVGGLFGLYIFSKLLKKSEYPIILFLLYFSNSFVYDMIQLRNTLCFLTILFGLEYLKKNKNKSYLILNTLATSFHTTALIYYFYFLLSKLDLKKFYKIIAILWGAGLFLVPIFKIIIIKLFPHKASLYFKAKVSHGFLLFYILVALDLGILFYNNIFSKVKKEDEVYLKFMLFPIIFLPYSVLTIELLHRVYRNALLIKWMFILKNIEKKDCIKKYLTIFILFLGAILPTVVYVYKDPREMVELVECLKNISL